MRTLLVVFIFYYLSYSPVRIFLILYLCVCAWVCLHGCLSVSAYVFVNDNTCKMF